MSRIINWKLRIKNPTFWFSIGIAFFTPILAYAGISTADITSWTSLADIILNAFANPFVLLLVLSSVYNSIIDPTTPGVKDCSTTLLAKIYVQPTGQNSEAGIEQTVTKIEEENHD